MMYRNTVEFEVFGPYGMFTDPILKVGKEKCSYEVPTYEALKGILASVYWKPTIIWVIDAVRVMNLIQTESKGIRTIMLKSDKQDLSNYTYLKNCRYQVRAHFIWNENRPELAGDRDENKHHQIAKRMIKFGGRRDVFLGTRECQGYVRPCKFGEGRGVYDKTLERKFGIQYHGITYADEAYSKETENWMTVRLWNPIMKNGVISFAKPEECTITRKIYQMGIKAFGKETNALDDINSYEKEGIEWV